MPPHPRKWFCVRWYFTVALCVVRRIMDANRGEWPKTISEWQIVANAHGYALVIVSRGSMRLKGICCPHRKVCMVQFTPNSTRFHRRVAHEVSHAVVNGGAPHGDLLDWPTEEDDAHIVARLVELREDVARGGTAPEWMI